MSSLSRRRTLALVAGGLPILAGCSGGPPDCDPRVGFRMEPVTNEDVAEATDRPPGDLQPLARDLVRSARNSGIATYRSAPVQHVSPEPFPISLPGDPTHRYVRLDGSHHRIAVDVAREGETTVYELVVRANDEVDDAARSGDAVAFEDLPTHDRRSLLGLLEERATMRSGVQFGQLWSIGYLREDHVASSRLVPRPVHEFVRTLDWYLAVERNDTGRDTRVTYEVALEHVADGDAGLAAAVKRTDGVDLDAADLSADQRAVLDDAAGGTRWVCLADASDRDEDDIVWVHRDGADGGVDRSTVADLVATIGDARYARYDGRWYAVYVPRWFANIPNDR